MTDQTSDQNSAHDYTTIMQQQQQQGTGLPVPVPVPVPSGDRTGHCSHSSSSSTPSLPSLKDQLHPQARQDFTALCHHVERQELERLDQSTSSIENVVVGAVEIEQSLNDTAAAAAITSRRSNRRRRGSNSQRALTTESHPFFDGTLEALIQQAERDDDDDDVDTNSNSTSDSNTLLASMDRLRVVDTSIRRTPRRGMRRPGRRISGRAARSA